MAALSRWQLLLVSLVLMSLLGMRQALALESAANGIAGADDVVVEGLLKGVVVDDKGRPMEGIIVRAMRLPDSTVVNGAATDSTGHYSIGRLPLGGYVLRYTAIGYTSAEAECRLSTMRREVTLPDAVMLTNDHMLGEAVVSGAATPVTVIDDTVAYNAAAFKVAEGAMAEELVQAIPGAEITDEGQIKINGKVYSKVLIDGQEFFGDDPQAALKNLPANIINRIKTYDRKSEQARLTGIDDGEEHNVLDIEVKSNMFKGIVGNVGVSQGNYSRYNDRVNLNRFRKKENMALVVNFNNVNNPAFSERGGGASNYSTQARSGYTASKSVGFTFAHEEKKSYKISANARYGYSNAEQKSDSHSETLYSNKSFRFSDSERGSDRRRHELNFNLRWEWKPDTLTNIQLRPNLSYNTTDDWSRSNSFAQRRDSIDDPVNTAINRQNSKSLNDGHSSDANVQFSLFRRLSPKGRNITLSGSLNYSDRESTNLSRSFVRFYLQPLRNRNYNRRFDGSSHSFGYGWGLAYNEPLLRNFYLQMRYNFNYRKGRSDRYGREFARLPGDTIVDDNMFIDWPTLEVDSNLSNCNSNNYTSHTINVNLRHSTPKLNLSYGIQLNPRHNETDYIFGMKSGSGFVQQDLMNWAPSIDFRYRFTKRTSLTFNYHGRSSEPDLNNLQQIIDKSNPQYTRYGNPNLKPSFSHNLRAGFNSYSEKTHRSLVSNWTYTNVNNTTSNMVLSESATGIRLGKLMNIDGQWSFGGNINFNTPLDSMRRWTLSSNSSINYNESANFNSTPLSAKQIKKADITVPFEEIAFEDIDKLAQYARKNHSNTIRYNQGLEVSLRTGIFNFRLGERFAYYRIHNSLRNTLSRETYTYTTTGNAQMELPWNGQLSTNINYVSCHGFSANIDKNLAIWNAQLTQRFFKRDAGLLSLQVFDILHMRSSTNRTFNNLTITDTHSLVLSNYFLLSFQYRINTMARRATRSMQRNGTQRTNGQRVGNGTNRQGGVNRNGNSGVARSSSGTTGRITRSRM